MEECCAGLGLGSASPNPAFESRERWATRQLQEAALTTAILSFLGVVMGASFQYVFTRYLDNQRHQRELRTQAYLDYLKSISGLAHLTGAPKRTVGFTGARSRSGG